MSYLQIISARYGANTIESKDVTSWVKNYAATQGIPFSIFVDPSTFGIVDPAKTIRKSLVITYTYGGNGPILVKSAVDGHHITMDPSILDITVVSAYYGSNNLFIDITERMQTFLCFNNANQNIMVGGSLFNQWFTFNKDIDPSVAKSLQITFIRNSQKFTVCANDGENISLSWAF